MNHDMVLVKQYETGVCEFFCEICGRRIVIQFSPFKKITLTTGDDKVQHTGGIGGLRIGNPETEGEDRRTKFWEEVLGKIDLGE